MNELVRRAAMVTVLLASLLLGGCEGTVGVGMSVGVPVGSHGYMSVSGTRWH